MLMINNLNSTVKMLPISSKVLKKFQTLQSKRKKRKIPDDKKDIVLTLMQDEEEGRLKVDPKDTTEYKRVKKDLNDFKTAQLIDKCREAQLKDDKNLRSKYTHVLSSEFHPVQKKK